MNAKGLMQLACMLPVLLAVFGIVGLAGCGGDGQSTLSGQVTLDGEPLETGTITFIPVDGQTATAGATIENGKYTVSLAPGAKRVEISANRVVGQRAAYEGDPNSPMIDITESIIPARYNAQSELTCEVQSGSNTENFELSSS